MTQRRHATSMRELTYDLSRRRSGLWSMARPRTNLTIRPDLSVPMRRPTHERVMRVRVGGSALVWLSWRNLSVQCRRARCRDGREHRAYRRECS